jgi:23S rRNA-/tRNA-specific pseudouridylate synthase
MRTGVTHQLRVHLASTGHAVLNDARYALSGTTCLIDAPSTDWHFLHAETVTFDDPAWPRGIATPFPAHWRPLFEARGWPMPAGA